MATPVAPIEFDEAGAWRWHVRTDSIRATTDALSGLWGRVAQEATSEAIGFKIRVQRWILMVSPRISLLRGKTSMGTNRRATQATVTGGGCEPRAGVR